VIKIPPPIQTFVAGTLMYAVDFFFPLSLFEDGGVVSLLILSLLALAMVFLMPAAYSFWKNKTTVNPIKPEKATTLVIEGVYRYSRNPMYVGMAAALLAWCIYLANPINLLVFGLFIYVITEIQIKPEERALVKLFGKDFRDYCQNVRRWL
jgi:protein-S-isoprenylcysteine O-methyltransferase Ste14